MKAFIVFFTLVAAVVADGDHAHAHAHAPVVAAAPVIAAGPAPLPILRAARPILAARPVIAPAPVLVREPVVVAAPAPLPVAVPAPVPVAVPAPTYGPAPVVVREPEVFDPPVYNFGYGVQGDEIHGSARFGHDENRNGYNTAGEYRVALPDGRTQIVSYRVDDATSGYVADVRYEGQAIAYEPPRPAYAPVA